MPKPNTHIFCLRNFLKWEEEQAIILSDNFAFCKFALNYKKIYCAKSQKLCLLGSKMFEQNFDLHLIPVDTRVCTARQWKGYLVSQPYNRQHINCPCMRRSLVKWRPHHSIDWHWPLFLMITNANRTWSYSHCNWKGVPNEITVFRN